MQLQTTLLLWAFVPLLVTLPLEVDVRRTIWRNIRLYNAVDLLLLTPVHFVVGDSLQAVLQTLGASRRSLSAYGFLWFVFLAGRCVHLTADAANAFVTEVDPALVLQTPQPLLELLHLLDEDISHVILWTGYFLAIAAAVTALPIEAPEGKRALSRNVTSGLLVPVLCAGVMGATHTVGLIESEHPEFGIVGGAAIAVLAASRRPWRGAADGGDRSVLCAFVGLFGVTILVGLAAYRSVFGAFIPPSAMGGVYPTARAAIATLMSPITSLLWGSSSNSVEL